MTCCSEPHQRNMSDQPENIEKSSGAISNNRLIAKNSVMLYLRMILSMLVGFYTSRVVLNTLGVEDFGVYGVVGGVVAMLGFLTASMSGATSRFLAFELGRNDQQRLSETFSSALIIHVALALVICLIAETVGLWFVTHKLVIPAGRMTAALWVYHLSVLSAMLGMIQVPYTAMVIAYEKMSVYAYLEILHVTLKLVIVYLLTIGNFDKLILYAVLCVGVTILIMLIYVTYCLVHYPASRFRWIWKPSIIKPMLSFSGWDLYGNASNMARTQGVNMLVNMFFGAAANAAVGVASTVQAVLMQFSVNISTAVRPQVVKSYSVGDHDRMSTLIYVGARYLYLLLLLVSVPILIEPHFVLKIWLKIVPEYSEWFVRYMILFNFFAQMSVVLAMGIHATGKVKRISLINGTLYLSVLPFTYAAYRMSGSIYSAFVFNVIAVFIGCLCNVYTLSLSVKQISLTRFIKKVLIPVLIISVIVFAVSYIPKFYLEEGWTRFLLVGLISTLSGLALTYFTADQPIKEFIKKKVSSYVRFGKHSNTDI